jgi:hypothetical protein
MAKQHRMAVLSAACVLALVLPAQAVLLGAAWVILLGSLLTCATRTRLVVAGLRAR